MTEQLTLLTWPDYINPITLEQFESEFGAKVNLEIVPSAVELIERMKSAGPTPDVLCPPDYAVRELGALGRLAALDHAQLSNFEHLEKRFQLGRPHDPSSHISVIKDWGTTGFMIRTDVIKEAPESWADFWRLAAKFSGRITVLDSPGEVIGAALKMRGHSYNASSPDLLAGARDDLLDLKPYLLAFETNYKPLLISGEACMALGWNGDAAALSAQGLPIKYVVPNEGSQIWEDDWAIAADAPNADLAHTFLNFVMRPEVAAQEARYTRYATGNRSALTLLDDEMRNDPSTYPPEAVLQKLEAGMPLDKAGQKRRDELWQEVRT
ncbi:MAG TPA: spermidine/putrescine ABC transporter substrate-binding protein [Anaerolineales bacterium]|nr:spermidine/putrescine ABC transporter substrate-binding protein [Anaerolineales bacterium]